MASRGIITASFKRESGYLDDFIANIRKCTDLPITIFTDDYPGPFCSDDNITNCFISTRWKDHKRYGQRNGDYWQARGVLECRFDEVLYLDDDMRIVSPDFVQGFELAEHFGLCLPLNPRGTVGIDGYIGADVTGEPEIPLATAYNCGTMFFNRKHSGAVSFLTAWIDIMSKNPQRGPMVAFRAALQTNFSPYPLQYNWCVCSEHIDIDNPIIVHTGHKDVAEKFN